LPCSDILRPNIPELLEENGVNFKAATLYRTVCSDLSDLTNVDYDVLVFFSPSGIKSLYQNFPGFKQKDTRIAVFGPTTAKAAEEAGLNIDIAAPQPESPSMTRALELYIKKANRNGRSK
jgi:uroporphyrinogen-III synthase